MPGHWRALSVLCTAALVAQRPALAWARPPVASAVAVGAPSSHAVPEAASVEALLFDVWRIVQAEESSGWLVDDLAFREIDADMMASVCAATPATRAEALRRLASEARERGEPSVQFERAGRQLTGAVQDALSAWRRSIALQRAVLAAPEQCPFWLQPDPSFRGRQSTRDRWVVAFDTGGVVQLRRTAREWTLGAGGSGRVLFGYSFTRLTLLGGVEFGGGALLEPGSANDQFRINYLPALPLVARIHQDEWHCDVELTPVALLQAGDTRLSYGLRAAATVGVSALRLRGIMPWVGLGMAAEYYFGNAARPGATYLRGGLRVGGVWDP